MTPQEKLILRFLLTILVVGLVIGYARRIWFARGPVVGQEAKQMADDIASIAEEKHEQYLSDAKFGSAEQELSEEESDPSGGVEIRVNLNEASKSELMSLPGIGPAIAERIILFRENYGSFKSVEELQRVKGIGKKMTEQLRDLVTF